MNPLAEIRKNKGVTQKEVSESTGISLRTLTRYEHDKHVGNIFCLKMLADYFDMTMDELYNVLFEDQDQKKE